MNKYYILNLTESVTLMMICRSISMKKSTRIAHTKYLLFITKNEISRKIGKQQADIEWQDEFEHNHRINLQKWGKWNCNYFTLFVIIFRRRSITC